MDRLDRRATLEDEIRRRLEKICSNLSEKDFDVLVEQIADNSLKGELRHFWPNGLAQGDHSSK